MTSSKDVVKRDWQWDVLSVSLTLVSRGLMLRDAVLGTTKRLRSAAKVEEFLFLSGGRRLAGAWADAGDEAPAVLICHGIGEPIGHWRGVQGFLRERG